MEITTPTIKTTHAPTIPPTVTGRLFVDWDNSIGNEPITKRITIYIIICITWK